MSRLCPIKRLLRQLGDDAYRASPANTMSNQSSIIGADAAELDATRAVYQMSKPLGCEAQTRVLDHVYALLRATRQRQLNEAQEKEEISQARGNTTEK